MPAIILIGIAVWFWFGSPMKTLANFAYPESAAPWEGVDAFYYPNSSDLTVHRELRGLRSLDECRLAVRTMALEYNDANLDRGDYECGVGPLEDEQFGGITVYRITAE